jgi:hypothetical protein
MVKTSKGYCYQPLGAKDIVISLLVPLFGTCTSLKKMKKQKRFSTNLQIKKLFKNVGC